MFFELSLELLTAGVERALNTFINAHKNNPHYTQLIGKSLKISSLNHHQTWVVLFSAHHIDCLRDHSFPADCTLSLSNRAIVELVAHKPLTELINSKDIILNGDLSLVQHFSSLLTEHCEATEWLSQYIGDVPAQLLANFFTKLTAYFKQMLLDERYFITENLTTELNIAVHKHQGRYFSHQVAELERAVYLLEKKVQSLVAERS